MKNDTVIEELLSAGKNVTTRDFLAAMPDIPAQTVYSRIRAMVQSGRIHRVSKGVYRPGAASPAKVIITPWMLQVNDFMIKNLPGVNNCISEKGGNLFVEVCKPDIPDTLSKLKANFSAVTELRKARPVLEDLHGYIIVSAMPTESPIDHSGPVAVPAVEKILVDAIGARDSSAQQLLQREFESGRPNISTLYRYASRKGILQKTKDAVGQLNTARISMMEQIRLFFASQPVDKAWLFGSFSRGEETPESDLDILVSFIPGARVSLLDHARMQLALEEKTGRPVDLVTEGTLLPFAASSAEHDKILIYERAG